MSKIIFMNVPAHGHVNPTLPVVRELLERSHQVIYYNTDEFRHQIERTGVEFRPYPMPILTSVEISELLADGNLVSVSQVLLETAERILPDMIALLEREQPDIIIHDSICIWGNMAAHILNIPAVSSITHFVFDDAMIFKQSWREILHIFRQAIPKLPRLVRLRRRFTRTYGKTIFNEHGIFPALSDLNIVYTARELHPDAPVIDDTFRFVGPSVRPAGRDHDFPFDQIMKRPVVYISLGTVHSIHTEFYQKAFAAFADHPGQFILSAGQHTDITQLKPIPDNFIVRQTVPQLEILQRVDVFITHGGMNSIHEGLYYGVPMILIPHQMEQLFNARQVVARGAGMLVNDHPLFKTVTANQLQQSLNTVLDNTGYREAAAQFCASLQTTGGYKQAVDEIESFIARQHNRSQGVA